MTDITMPKLSDTMTEGRFVSWKKSVGEQVERGDIIAEVETDKANMELEAFASGILLETRAHPGELVAVGAVIGVIGSTEELAATPQQATPEPAAVPPAPPSSPSPDREKPPGAMVTQPFAPHAEKHDHAQAAPAVRRRARELGIDLVTVRGSGPEGRILMEDLERIVNAQLVESAGSAESPAAVVEEVPQEVPRYTGSEEGTPLSRMRSAIARTVTDAWRNIPHFFVTVDVRMDEAEEVRRELQESGMQISINDLVVKAAALAAGSHPLINSSLTGDRIIIHDHVNIGIAVGLPDGLLVPVLKGCESFSLKEIAVQGRILVDRARSGHLSESEMGGGTFTVSNLGMYGIDEFAAVIHPPQAAILAVGAIRDTVAAINGHPEVTRMMKLSVSADHRIIDGRYAAEFLMRVKYLLENPVNLLA